MGLMPFPPADGGSNSPGGATPSGQVERWIRQAKGGSQSALGRLLEASRKYVLLVANQALDDELKSKVGASDLVQDTFLDAQRGFAQFRGTTEQELHGWLIGILAHRVANNARHYRGTLKRSVQRECAGSDAEAMIAQFRDEAATPMTASLAKEEAAGIRAAMDKLDERLRSLLIERTWERLPFAEIGQRRNCSAEAARKLWARAVQELQKIHRAMP